ncbi:hypothetical protein UlMin_026803 [Ulmus minor]
MTEISIIVMGCGGFGRQLLQHIVSCRVVGLCDSKSLVVVPDVWTTGLSDNFLLEVCWMNGSGECQVFKDSESTTTIEDIASLLGKSIGLALVACSASSETISVLNLVVDFDCCIVLANKKPRTSKMEDYDKLVSHPCCIWHKSTVGAGFLGTLGYVLSEVEDGKPFSQVALILSQLLGQRLSMDSIKIESLYLEAIGPNVTSIDKFLGNVSLPGKDIQERVHKASLNRNVLRYVCVIEGHGDVGIRELPKNSAFGRLRGSDNVLEIYSRYYSGQPLVSQGAGAGNDTTACGVLADIIDVWDLFP